MSRSGVASLLFLLATGCFYTLSGGGGVPSHLKTVAVIPFENQTASPDLQSEFTDALRKELHDRLGLRDAPEERANAVVRGTITRYEPDVPVGFSADPSRATSARRRVQIVIDIEILDAVTDRPLFEKKGMSAEGEYAEQQEPAGRKQAIQRIINDIIEGAQSQW